MSRASDPRAMSSDGFRHPESDSAASVYFIKSEQSCKGEYRMENSAAYISFSPNQHTGPSHSGSMGSATVAISWETIQHAVPLSVSVTTSFEEAVVVGVGGKSKYYLATIVSRSSLYNILSVFTA